MALLQPPFPDEELYPVGMWSVFIPSSLALVLREFVRWHPGKKPNFLTASEKLEDEAMAWENVARSIDHIGCARNLINGCHPW